MLLTEAMDKAEREAFDTKLESEPVLRRVKPGGRLPTPGEQDGIEQMMALMALPQAGG